ncbi:MAG: TetR/AcrR family transcriptional regulator, partial [Actinomycetota bacterium]|nr:TetR/AcrR family transcriptional regulator [Actinomycetota bacterium]
RDPTRDAAILDAALEMFIEHGITATSIEQIAKRAGVGKPTVYRRWSSKEQLVADAIEAHVGGEIDWPIAEQIAAIPVDELVRRNIAGAARTAADPRFRALVAAIFGSAVSHPLLMQTYWTHYIVPRRALTIAMLARAQADGAVAPDADLDVIVDMLAGAVTYRVLQPDPPNFSQMKRYLTAAYRQVGLLP